MLKQMKFHKFLAELAQFLELLVIFWQWYSGKSIFRNSS
jgi:hypothetical protein